MNVIELSSVSAVVVILAQVWHTAFPNLKRFLPLISVLLGGALYYMYKPTLESFLAGLIAGAASTGIYENQKQARKLMIGK